MECASDLPHWRCADVIIFRHHNNVVVVTKDSRVRAFPGRQVFHLPGVKGVRVRCHHKRNGSSTGAGELAQLSGGWVLRRTQLLLLLLGHPNFVAGVFEFGSVLHDDFIAGVTLPDFLQDLLAGVVGSGGGDLHEWLDVGRGRGGLPDSAG
jgi:hypothetical protein